MNEKETPIMTTQPKKARRSRGQALVEFSLIAPILLVVVLAIFDYGRVLLVYANASTNLRDAARTSQVSGLGGSDYADCALIENEAQDIWFATVDDVRILYYDNTNFTGYDNPTYSCPGDGGAAFTPDDLQNGFMMRVEVDASIEFITPFLRLIDGDLDRLEMQFFSQRTVLKAFEIRGDTNDFDADGLDDYWELIWFGCAAVGGGGHEPTVPGSDPPDGFQGTCETDDEGNPVPWLERYGAFDDPDNDGATNGVEEIRGTNPIGVGSEDSDNDGLTDEEEINGGVTLPTNPDSDGDGLNDFAEVRRIIPCRGGIPYPDDYESNPTHQDNDDDGVADGYDTDGDGLNDFEELCGDYMTNPADEDTDDDDVTDYDEINGYDTQTIVNGENPPHIAFTDPTNPDSDGDGLEDGAERDGNPPSGYRTYPDDRDTDDDGLEDGYEISSPYDISPTEEDSDFDDLKDQSEIQDDGNGRNDNPRGDADPEIANTDGPENEQVLEGLLCNLRDGEERNFWGTSPSHLDTDDDGLTDCEEVRGYPTDPVNPDSDGDGYDDGVEVEAYCDPMDPAITPAGGDCDEDLDGDGLPDQWELRYWDPFTDYDDQDDNDGDQCNNMCEYIQATNPLNPDTDGDGRTDWEEPSQEPYSDPLDEDTDDDGLWDGDELTYNTDPRAADTDGEGLLDGEEVGVTITPGNVSGGLGTLPRDVDTDNDGINDYHETIGWIVIGDTPGPHGWGPTDPLQEDGDRELGFWTQDLAGNPRTPDTLTDYEEIILYNTDPNEDDTDDDGLPDNVEIDDALTDPTDPDTDGDGLEDGQEYYDGVTYLGIQNYEMTFCAGTEDETVVSINLTTLSPLNPDRDGDLLLDGQEVNVYNTNPTNVDSDGDDVDDDSDLNDYEEATDGNVATDPVCAQSGDPNDTDGDGISNADELAGTYGYVTDPFNEDTDQDGIDDYTEMVSGFDMSINYVDKYNNPQNIAETIFTDPTNNDTDGDGLLDGEEKNGTYIYRTHPLMADTDGDNLTDGDEINIFSTNPLNAYNEWQRQYKAQSGIWEILTEYWANGEEAAIEEALLRGFTVNPDGTVYVRVQPTGGNFNAIKTLILDGGGTIAAEVWGGSAMEVYVSMDVLGQLLLDTRVNYMWKL